MDNLLGIGVFLIGISALIVSLFGIRHRVIFRVDTNIDIENTILRTKGILHKINYMPGNVLEKNCRM
jgi:hypothetical protein